MTFDTNSTSARRCGTIFIRDLNYLENLCQRCRKKSPVNGMKKVWPKWPGGVGLPLFRRFCEIAIRPACGAINLATLCFSRFATANSSKWMLFGMCVYKKCKFLKCVVWRQLNFFTINQYKKIPELQITMESLTSGNGLLNNPHNQRTHLSLLINRFVFTQRQRPRPWGWC